MVFRDIDKKALIDNAATVVTKVTVIRTGQTFTEDDFVSEWTYEDYRYVPETGFIGQFVERLFDGKMIDLPSDVTLENEEINLQVGIVNNLNGETTYYDYGNFIVTDVKKEDTTGATNYQSSDYTKKFNKPYVSNIGYPCLALELLNDACNQAEVELASDGEAYCYSIDKDGIGKGDFSFAIHDDETGAETYYNFSLTKDMRYKDSLLYIAKDNKLIQRTINDDFTVSKVELPVEISSETNNEILDCKVVKYVDFINNDFVIIDNQFEADETLREVVKSVAKLGYTWVRVGTDNKVHLDFEPKDTQTYGLEIEGKCVQNTLGKNLYYGTSDEYAFKTTTSQWYYADGALDAYGPGFADKTLYKGAVKKGVTYTFTSVINAATRIQLCYDDEEPIKVNGVDDIPIYIIDQGVTFTAKKDGYVILRVYAPRNRNILVMETQLEEGTESTEYEDYLPNKIPNPDHPVEIQTVHGVTNLFDKDNFISLLAHNDGTNLVSNDGNMVIAYKCKPNTTYTIQKIVSRRFAIGTSAAAPTLGTYNTTYKSYTLSSSIKLDNVYGVGTNEVAFYTYKTNSTAQYLYFEYWVNNETIRQQEVLDSIMIVDSCIPHKYVSFGTWLEQNNRGNNVFNILEYTIKKERYFDNKGTIQYGANNTLFYPIEVEKNTNYALSSNYNIGRIVGLPSKTSESGTEIKSVNAKQTTFNTGNYEYIGFHIQTANEDYEIMLNKGLDYLPYEQYKENSAIINMNKPNLFDKDNYTKILGYFGRVSGGQLLQSPRDYCVYIPCETNTIYSVSKALNTVVENNRFRLGTTNVEPYVGCNVYNIVDVGGDGTLTTSATVSTDGNSKYLIIWISNSLEGLEEILDSIKVYEGVSPYYELCSIGDIKDTYKDGVITKRIGKIVLNGSESYTNDGRRYYTTAYNTLMVTPLDNSTKAQALSNIGIITATDTYNQLSGLAIHPNGSIYLSNDAYAKFANKENIELYVVLKEPYEIKVPYEKLKLFPDYNDISLNDEIADFIIVEDAITIEDYYENVNPDNMYGPVNKVSIGMSNVEGETIYNSIDRDCIDSFEIEGKSVQDVTTQGKNLFNPSKFVNKYNVSINGDVISSTGISTVTWSYSSSQYMTKLQSGTYYLTLFFTKNETQNYSGVRVFNTNSNILATDNNIINRNKVTINFTLSQETDIGVMFKLGDGICKMQIEKNSATDYEPYIPNSPSPDYPSEIKSVKGVTNLFDKENYNELSANFDTNTSKIVASANAKSIYIPCKPNTTYKISRMADVRFQAVTTSVVPAVGVAYSNYGGDNTGSLLTIKTSSTAKYLCVYYWHNSSTKTPQELLETLMIEEGTTSHFKTYTNYSSNIFDKNNLELGLYNQGTINTIPTKIERNTALSISPDNAIEVIPNTKYKITTYSNWQISVVQLDKDKKLLNTGSWNTSTNITITTLSNAKYLQFNLQTNNSAVITDDLKNTISNNLEIQQEIITYKYYPYGAWLEESCENKNLVPEKVDYVFTKSTQTSEFINRVIKINSDYIKPGDTLTLSYYLKRKGDSYSPYTDYRANRFGIHGNLVYETVSGNQYTVYPFASYIDKSENDGVLKMSYTIDPNIKKILRFDLSLQLVTRPADTSNEIWEVRDVQLEKSSEATPYEEFKENIATINMTKPNLFDNELIKNGYTLSGQNGNLVYDASYLNNTFTSDEYIKVTKGTNITSNVIIRNYAKYDNDKTFISRVVIDKNSFTSDFDGYIRLAFNGNATNLKGSVGVYNDTSATPYYELCSIRDVKDTYKNGVITKRIGKRILTGSETITLHRTPNNMFKIANITGFINQSGATYSRLLCDRFVEYHQSDMYNNPSMVGISAIGGTTNAIYVQFGSSSDINSVDKFKNWLSNNPLTVYYVLNEPYEIEVPHEKLENFTGYNYVSVNDDLKPNIKVDVKDVYKNITEYEGTYIEFESKPYEECAIQIWDNPLTYTEELRRIALNGSDSLIGMKYLPMTTDTVGHPWLEGDDYIKLTNLNGDILFTYPFDRKLTYSGFIKSQLSSKAMSSVAQKLEYKGGVSNRLLHTEIQVNKAEGSISSIVSEIDGLSSASTEMSITLGGITTRMTEIDGTLDEQSGKITEIKETLDGISVEKTVIGGSNLLKNSVGYFGNDYWQINDTTEGKILGNDSSDVKIHSISGSALQLQNETVYQNINSIKSGQYYISFTYKKLNANANCYLEINSKRYDLTNTDWTEISEAITVDLTNISIVLYSNVDNSCLITDLMLTEGNSKTTWSQNSNETYTDGVKIGKGITITATGSDTSLEATASGIDIKNTDNGTVTSTFTKYGTETNSLVSHGNVRIQDQLLISKVGDQIWISTI